MVSKLNNFIIKSVRKWVSDQVPKPEGLSLMLVSSIEQIKGHKLGLQNWFIQFVKRISQAQPGSGFGLQGYSWAAPGQIVVRHVQAQACPFGQSGQVGFSITCPCLISFVWANPFKTTSTTCLSLAGPRFLPINPCLAQFLNRLKFKAGPGLSTTQQMGPNLRSKTHPMRTGLGLASAHEHPYWSPMGHKQNFARSLDMEI